MYLIYLPNKPVVGSFSEDWLKWTQDYFQSVTKQKGMDFQFETLLPKVIEERPHDDPTRFRAQQIEMAIAWIENHTTCGDKLGDTIFYTQDGWFPGIEMLAYIRDARGLDFKMACCLHGGSWDKYDFTVTQGMKVWSSYIEKSLFHIYDLVFVATGFHKSLILVKSGFSDIDNLQLRLHTTGFPIFMPEFTNVGSVVKDDFNKVRIVFPFLNRKENNPAFLDLLGPKLIERLPGKEIICISTCDTCKSRDEYYSTLSNADYAVSFAESETWGITIQDAVLCGCIPIVPDRLAYQTMYPVMFRYGCQCSPDESVKNAAERIVFFENLKEQGKLSEVVALRKGVANEILLRGSNALPRQVALMQSLLNGQQLCVRID